MTYQTTITQKGQIVIPRKLRAILGLEKNIRITLELDHSSRTIKINPAPTILDLAGKFKPEKTIPATEIRNQMNKFYGKR